MVALVRRSRKALTQSSLQLQPITPMLSHSMEGGSIYLHGASSVGSKRSLFLSNGRCSPTGQFMIVTIVQFLLGNAPRRPRSTIRCYYSWPQALPFMAWITDHHARFPPQQFSRRSDGGPQGTPVFFSSPQSTPQPTASRLHMGFPIHPSHPFSITSSTSVLTLFP